MANEKISDLNIQNSPSNFATLVGVDNGETVQIPINTFARPSDIPSISGLATEKYVDDKIASLPSGGGS